MSKSVLFWRRIDVEGFERLELAIEPDGVSVVSPENIARPPLGQGPRMDVGARMRGMWR